MSKPVFKRPFDPVSSQQGPTKKIRLDDEFTLTISQVIKKSYATLQQLQNSGYLPSKEIKAEFLESVKALNQLTYNLPIKGPYDPNKPMPVLPPEIWIGFILPKLKLKDWVNFRKLSQHFRDLSRESPKHVNKAIEKALKKLSHWLKETKRQQRTLNFLDQHRSHITEINLKIGSSIATGWIRENIKSMTSLKILNLEKTLVHDKFLDAISSSETIERFDFNTWGIHLKSDELRHILTCGFPLKTLEIIDEGCSVEVAKQVFKCLKTNQQLQNLTLEVKSEFHSHEEDNEEFFYDLGRPLADMIALNQRLETLKVSYLYIKDKEAEMIAEALKKNTTLKRLDLSKCDMFSVAREVIDNEFSP